MSGNDIIGLVITIIIGLMLIVMGLILHTGRGSFLIAGYNTLSSAEKEQYDTKKLCRFVGKILLFIGFITPLFAIGGIYDIEWLPIACSFGIIALCVFAVIYCNTGNRFKKQDK